MTDEHLAKCLHDLRNLVASSETLERDLHRFNMRLRQAIEVLSSATRSSGVDLARAGEHIEGARSEIVYWRLIADEYLRGMDSNAADICNEIQRIAELGDNPLPVATRAGLAAQPEQGENHGGQP